MVTPKVSRRALLWIGLAGLGLILAACGASGTSGGPSLAQTAWTLTELDGEPPIGNAPLTAVYGEAEDEVNPSEVFGSTGCNSFKGPYSTEGDAISMGPFITTLAGCVNPPVQAQEGLYLITLETAAGFSVSGETLELRNEAGDTTAKFQRFEPDLTLTNWEATSINNSAGGVESAIQGTVVTIEFGEVGLLAGSGGCNTYSSAYRVGEDYDVVSGGSIAIAGIASTRKACGDDIDEQEQNYYTALENAAVWVIRGLNLELRDAEGALQVQYKRAG